MMTTVFFDRAMFVLVCLLLFFLPATNAVVESASAAAILVFILKRFTLKASAFKALPAWPVLLPLLLFVGWSGVSAVWSSFPVLSLKGFLGKTLQGAFLLLISYEMLSSRKRFCIALVVFLVSAALISMDGVWQVFSGYDIFVHAPFTDGRAMAAFKHPNDFGAYLLFVILPVIVLTVMTGVRSFSDYTLKNALLAFGGIFLTGISAAALGLTYSRGAWLGMVMAAAIFIGLNRRLWPVVLAFMVLFLLVFQPLLLKIRDVSFTSDRVALRSDHKMFSGDGRLGFWQDALKIIHDHPVFGTGLNTYTPVIKDYSVTWKAYPHNCYLQMGAELGLVGLALFLWLLTAVMIEVVSRIRALPIGPERWLLAAFFAGWCGFLVHSALDTSLYSSQLTAVFWVLTGGMLAFGKLVPGTESLTKILQ